MNTVVEKSAKRNDRQKKCAPLTLIKSGDKARTPPKPIATQYRTTDHGLVLQANHGAEVITNFHAEIVGDIEVDDGESVTRVLEIKARLGSDIVRFKIPAVEFTKMGWAVQRIGATAIIAAGKGHRDHARAAIQHLSRNVEKRQVFAHTGWRQVGGKWVFLHGGGAIGANGAMSAIEVELPESLRYELPTPPTGKRLRAAIEATLRFLEVAHGSITYPCLAAAFRVVLGDCDFSIHLAGPTGAGKSEIAALVQQHFGPEMDARHLPGNWSSTVNALEALAFAAKDSVFVVDDFAPTGTQFDVQQRHRDADRLFRNQGNRAARQRLSAESDLKAPKQPRGLILSTGEDVPRGASLRARMLVEEVTSTTINWKSLTNCQKDAANGLYAETMAGFVQWTASPYDSIQSKLRGEIADLRDQALSSASHRRTAAIVANLGVGLRYFLDFAVSAGAMSKEDAVARWKIGWFLLGKASERQIQHQADNEPAGSFIRLLAAALSSGGAHIAGVEGSEPSGNPSAWGWREVTVGTGDNERTEWRYQGSRVGWVDGEDVFLNPDASFKAAQSVGKDTGDALAVSAPTLRKRLHEQGLLATTDTNRRTLMIRKQLEGHRRDVLHLKSSALFPWA